MSLDYDGALIDDNIVQKNMDVSHSLLSAFSHLAHAHAVMFDIGDLRTGEITTLMKSIKRIILLSPFE